ncbi:MAG: hypothetical protein ABTD50_11515 [Polyangiaceae bacterium]|jgi:hypothetical protein
MLFRVRDLVELLTKLPDGLGTGLDGKAIPEESVVLRHLFPASAEHNGIPAGPLRLSLGGVHTRILPLADDVRPQAHDIAIGFSLTPNRPGCCFPTTGSVTTTVVDGSGTGNTETMSFTPLCGETVLTTDGATRAVTLAHCL